MQILVVNQLDVLGLKVLHVVFKEYKTCRFCDINTMEHEGQETGSLRTRGVAECFSWFSSALYLPECLYHSILL